ncbi:MAG: hypothetical protein J6L59_02890 [Clostridia bacterium]|nr:hypothetical protein [Clostridia bacterium]
MKIRTVLFADSGKMLTNGENFGTQIFLAENEMAESYYEITKEEYDKISAEKEQESSADFN